MAEYQELPAAPAVVFPVKNEVTGNTVWFEISPSQYGVYVLVHKERPALEDSTGQSPETAMAAVHVDYFAAHNEATEPTEQIKVQLWDEQEGPYGDAGWLVPPEYWWRHRDAGIVLVGDVEAWKKEPE